jgi:hypothetical protein
MEKMGIPILQLRECQPGEVKSFDPENGRTGLKPGSLILETRLD